MYKLLCTTQIAQEYDSSISIYISLDFLISEFCLFQQKCSFFDKTAVIYLSFIFGVVYICNLFIVHTIISQWDICMSNISQEIARSFVAFVRRTSHPES